MSVRLDLYVYVQKLAMIHTNSTFKTNQNIQSLYKAFLQSKFKSTISAFNSYSSSLNHSLFIPSYPFRSRPSNVATSAVASAFPEPVPNRVQCKTYDNERSGFSSRQMASWCFSYYRSCLLWDGHCWEFDVRE